MRAQTARRIACDSVCTLVTVAASPPTSSAGSVTSGNAAEVQPLSVGRATRIIPQHIRTALVVRDKRCRFPGCDRPPAWTDGHHVQHWADGGRTELPNLLLLCRRHHRALHEKGWQVRIDDLGAPVVTAPP